MPDETNNADVGSKSDGPSPPTVYVVAGPNGAGKTTFAGEFLPNFADCREFLNADLIAAGLSPFAPETQNVRAGRLLLTRMRELTALRQDFGFETTLAGRSYARRFRNLKALGYRVVLFFLWLPDVELAVSRVAMRVQRGGHYVSETDIRRRFISGVRNFFGIYRSLVDSWRLVDASRIRPRWIAFEEDGQLQVLDAATYGQALRSAKEIDR